MSENKVLLQEYVDLQYERGTIREQIEKHEPIMLKGIIQRANAPNANKRIYPRHILEREINNYQKLVKENRAVGELDHPSESVVELKNVSHVLRKVWWEGNDVMGSLEVLNTPNGKILQSLLDGDIKIGISSRGVGSLKEDGQNNLVEDDFILVCFDIVSDPSNFGSFLMKENVDINQTLRQLTKADRLNRILNNIIS